jgi:hypothetical protein
MMHNTAIIFSVDNKILTGVASGYLLKTGNGSATSPVRYEVFFRPVSKGVPGSAANILNTRAAIHCCFELPGTIYRISKRNGEPSHA